MLYWNYRWFHLARSTFLSPPRSSHFVSPVLAKMFAWEFRSRPSDSLSKVPVISFPEDDLEVFTLLCRIAHHQIDDLPTDIPLDLLVKFATTCDKFDCVSTVSHTSFRWLKIDINDHSSVDLNRLLYCAYVLIYQRPLRISPRESWYPLRGIWFSAWIHRSGPCPYLYTR